jgi:hypothetical protein
MKSPVSIAATALTILALATPCAVADVRVSYLYRLSDFSGTVPLNYVPLHVDRHHDEIYVAQGNIVRVFNAAGMEIYWFGYETELGLISAVNVDERGDIWILSYDRRDPVAGPQRLVTRCNYRGVPQERMELSGLPADLEPFRPDRMIRREDGIVFASSDNAIAVRTDLAGGFVEAWDLGELIGAEELGASSPELGGIVVDHDGNLVFSIPVLFRVFVVAPDRSVQSFGRPGSAPGRFGVVAGVERDRHGNVLVADKQRSVVMVFDRDFNFLTEFGYYGSRQDNLARPAGLAIGNGDRLYVTQLRNRGVSVYSVTQTDRAGSSRPTKEVRKSANTTPHDERTQTARPEATTARGSQPNGGINPGTVPGSPGPTDQKIRRTP